MDHATTREGNLLTYNLALRLTGSKDREEDVGVGLARREISRRTLEKTIHWPEVTLGKTSAWGYPAPLVPTRTYVIPGM